MQDLRNNVNPRIFVTEMLHLARAANFTSTYNQLIVIWNRFQVTLRRDIPEPTQHTSLGQFLDQIDSKTAVWYELANRPSYQSPSQHQTGATNKMRSSQVPPQRIPTNGGKSYAYLVDINEEDGYGIYEEENNEENQETYA